MEIVYFLAMCLCNLACFLIGAKVGQQVSKGEKIEVPNLNPVEAVRDIKEKHEARQEEDRMATIMGNLEAYDGTSVGQKEVPRR